MIQNKNIIDHSDLRRVILSSADQFLEGRAIAQNVDTPKNFTSIVISGMGGSALPANVLRTYINHFF